MDLSQTYGPRRWAALMPIKRQWAFMRDLQASELPS